MQQRLYNKGQSILENRNKKENELAGREGFEPPEV